MGFATVPLRKVENSKVQVLYNLLNNFINNTIDYVDKEETHSPVILELKITGLLFADDLAVASFTSRGLQKKTGGLINTAEIGIYDII
jgi:hypothetical protein